MAAWKRPGTPDVTRRAASRPSTRNTRPSSDENTTESQWTTWKSTGDARLDVGQVGQVMLDVFTGGRCVFFCGHVVSVASRSSLQRERHASATQYTVRHPASVTSSAGHTDRVQHSLRRDEHRHRANNLRRIPTQQVQRRGHRRLAVRHPRRAARHQRTRNDRGGGAVQRRPQRRQPEHQPDQQRNRPRRPRPAPSPPATETARFADRETLRPPLPTSGAAADPRRPSSQH